MNLVFMTLVKSYQVFVILGGSGAANFNDYNYTKINNHVFSYHNDKWVTAESPMIGGDGERGSHLVKLGK